MQNNYDRYGQSPSGCNQYTAYNNQYIQPKNNMQNNYCHNIPLNYQHITTNGINNIKDDSSSRDKYYNDHVACIVFGNNEFYKENLQIAKKLNKDVDQFVGTGFSFGKYLNFEADEKEWQAQLEDLRKQLSDNNSKFANLKGIKFVLDEHGREGDDRNLAGVPPVNQPYYKSERFQQVAEIINDCFLQEQRDNKLYFVNTACYGAYFFDELKTNVSNDIPRSNNIYEILSNTFRLNNKKVYCSQLIPQSGINASYTMNLNHNPYRNGTSFSTQIGHYLRKGEKYSYDSGPHDFRKKYYFTYRKLTNTDQIPSPECKIYFPLEKFQSVVPNALCLKPNGPKEYRVDSKILENYTGKTAKDMKNDFLKWGDKPKYAHFKEDRLFIDPTGRHFDNLQKCVVEWKTLYEDIEKKEAQTKEQLQKNHYYKKKMREKDDCCIAF